MTMDFRRFVPAAGLTAILGIIGVFVGMGSDKTSALQSYYFAWIFWALIALGCLGLQFLHHSVRASWGLCVLRLVEAGSSPLTLLVTALAFIPIGMNMGEIYWWAAPGDHHGLSWQHFRMSYLSPGPFAIRFVLYFLVWMFLSHKLQTSSRAQDESLDPQLGIKRHTLGPVSLLIFFVTMTFAISDWLMGLEQMWFSTILPLLSAVGAGLSALSLCVLLILRNRDKEPYAAALTPQLSKDLGNMLFALTLVWQYMTLSQYLITYSGHLPEELPYYLKRNAGGWEFMITLIILFQFFVPFIALLAPRLKRHAQNMVWVVVIIFVMRIFDIYWTVMPSLRGGGENPQGVIESISHWTDYVAFLGLGGLWFALFGMQVHKAELLPKHDTRLLEVEHAH